MESTENRKTWSLELENKTDFDMSMSRVNAWFDGEIIDRAPVRFFAHNSFVEDMKSIKKWNNLKDRWFDTEYQVESFMKSIENSVFLGETFPVFWPNLGPNVFAGFYNTELLFADVTSWAEPCLDNLQDVLKLKLDLNNEYFKKIEELTDYALARCKGRFMVGYTDIHPGMDCLAAWRDTQKLCIDLYDDPEGVKTAIDIASKDFRKIFDLFDRKLKQHNQLSVSWMGVPSFGKMHIPSCDFSAMISSEHFEEYCLPVLQKEVKEMTHNIFHMDGKGVARHLDMILEIPEIQAIQWVQGEGEDKPIMKWIPLLNRIRDSGKSIIIDLAQDELENFISQMSPEGVFICIPANGREEQERILSRIEKW